MMAEPPAANVGDGEALDDTGRPWVLRCWELETRLLRSEYERELAEWRTRRLRDRRAWRMMEAATAALRDPRLCLRLPVDLYGIATDRRDSGPQPHPPQIPEPPVPVRASPLPALRRARRAFDARQYESALADAEEALENDPEDVRSLDVAWRSLEALGELTRALRCVRRQRSIQDRSRLALAERRLQGTLIALDPRWSPTVPAFEGAIDGPFLILSTDERGPAVEHENVVHLPGQPDLGTSYDFASLPLDVAVQDLVWLGARNARRERPRAIVARLTTDLGLAIAAGAMADTARLPFYLLRTSDGPIEESQRGELRRRRSDDLRVAARRVVGSLDELASPRVGGA